MSGHRRILVALDTSAGARAALHRAASMARRMEAELTGLFVEDQNLLRLAGLPFARELFAGGTGRRDLSPETMERALANEALQLQRELKAAAVELDVPWSFHTARGRVFQELLAATVNHELVAMGMADARPGQLRLGSNARHLLAESACSVMLIPPGTLPTGVMLVMFDGSASSRAALSRAQQMREPEQALEILLLAEVPGRLTELREQASSLLERDQAVTFHIFTAGDAAALVAAVLRLAPATLVLGELQNLGADVLEGVLGRLHGTVLQVRDTQ